MGFGGVLKKSYSGSNKRGQNPNRKKPLARIFKRRRRSSHSGRPQPPSPHVVVSSLLRLPVRLLLDEEFSKFVSFLCGKVFWNPNHNSSLFSSISPYFQSIIVVVVGGGGPDGENNLRLIIYLICNPTEPFALHYLIFCLVCFFFSHNSQIIIIIIILNPNPNIT